MASTSIPISPVSTPPAQSDTDDQRNGFMKFFDTCCAGCMNVCVLKPLEVCSSLEHKTTILKVACLASCFIPGAALVIT
ncbi:MAG: hypothetical protein KR126chlam3_01596 [Chlamydiae bacterium]|nr:hypothetical protein [Chlamydiota bacterium]